MPTAQEQLDLQYHEMRWRILSLAADIDRIERYAGGPQLLATDPRIADLKKCVEELLSTTPGRAQRVQEKLSL
jgi:hypothetical protein